MHSISYSYHFLHLNNWGLVRDICHTIEKEEVVFATVVDVIVLLCLVFFIELLFSVYFRLTD